MKSEKSYLGFDFGTQGAKGVLIDGAGRILMSYHIGYGVIHGSSGQKEQDPKTYYDALLGLCRILGKHEAYSRVEAISVSGQMHGIIPVKNDGEPAGNAIIWMDNRSAGQCERYKSIFEKNKCVNSVLPVYTAPKILWFREERKEAYKKTCKFIFVKDYVKYLLCKKWSTDYSDASGSLLFDFENNRWNEQLLDQLSLNSDLFPVILPSCAIVGHLCGEMARILSLKSGIPIANGMGDLASGLAGNGVKNENQMLVMISTSGQLMLRNRKVPVSMKKGLHYFKLEDEYTGFYLSSIPTAGLCCSWLSRQIGEVGPPGFKHIDDLAASIETTDLLFGPYLAGSGSPHHDPDMRGYFIGLTDRHTNADMARAVLEGVAMAMYTAFMSFDTAIESIVLAGGGAKSAVWSQIFSSVFNKEILRNLNGDLSALGSAYNAANSVNAGIKVPMDMHKVYPDSQVDYYRKKILLSERVYSTLKRITDEIESLDINKS